MKESNVLDFSKIKTDSQSKDLANKIDEAKTELGDLLREHLAAYAALNDRKKGTDHDFEVL